MARLLRRWGARLRPPAPLLGPEPGAAAAGAQQAQLQAALVAFLQGLEGAAAGPAAQLERPTRPLGLAPGAPSSNSSSGSTQRHLTAVLEAPAAAPRPSAQPDPGPRRAFRLAVLPSTIPGAGHGLFLTAGSIPAGGVATLYPGLVYDQETFLSLCTVPAEDCQAISPPSFTVSNNSLLSLRCGAQLLLVDGRPRGFSARRFLGSAAEAAEGGGPAVNSCWVEGAWASSGAFGEAAVGAGCCGALPSRPSSGSQTAALLQQAALGHLVNHPPPDGAASLAFDVCIAPPSLDAELLSLLPSLPFQAREGWAHTRPAPERPPRWVPLLVALRTLQADAWTDPLELFVEYGADPLALGFQPWHGLC